MEEFINCLQKDRLSVVPPVDNVGHLLNTPVHTVPFSENTPPESNLCNPMRYCRFMRKASDLGAGWTSSSLCFGLTQSGPIGSRSDAFLLLFFENHFTS